MTDVEVGRRQERQPRRNDLPAAAGRARAHRLRHHGPCLPPVPGPRRAWPQRINARLAALDTEDVRALAAAGAEIRAWVEAQPFPADLEKAIREAFATLCAGNDTGQLRRALLGHRRRPARRLVRRPAGDLPERGRHRRRAAQDEGGVRLPLQRPRHQLPRAQGLCPCRRGAVGRRAAHGAQRPRRRRRDVHHRHRVRLPGRGVHHLQLRPGRDGGAGRREPRRVLRAQAHARRPASAR